MIGALVRSTEALLEQLKEEDAALIKMVRPAMDAGANSLSVEVIDRSHDARPPIASV